jgi:hypothetical protein
VVEQFFVWILGPNLAGLLAILCFLVGGFVATAWLIIRVSEGGR